MTNELDKQFFDTFGIEPKCQNAFVNPADCPFNKAIKCCDCESFEYPKITSDILLELICILNSVSVEFKSECIEDLKREILGEAIILLEYAPNEETGDFIKHQVRTLFGE